MQGIAAFDIRLFNMDRHINNLLVFQPPKSVLCDDDPFLYPSRASNRAYRSQSTCVESETRPLQLVPIDHGYTLPVMTTRQIPEWCWLHWFQTKQGMTEEVRAYVMSLDAERDGELLKYYLPGIEEEAIHTLRVNTLWLKLVGVWEESDG